MEVGESVHIEEMVVGAVPGNFLPRHRHPRLAKKSLGRKYQLSRSSLLPPAHLHFPNSQGSPSVDGRGRVTPRKTHKTQPQRERDPQEKKHYQVVTS